MGVLSFYGGRSFTLLLLAPAWGLVLIRGEKHNWPQPVLLH